MQARTFLAVASVAAVVLAGCSGRGAGNDGSGGFTLVVEEPGDASFGLKGAFLRGEAGWVPALANGTKLTLGSDGNASAAGEVPAGSYDRLRLLFDDVRRGGQAATATQSGIEVALNLTVTEGGAAAVALAFAWSESFFDSAQGLAFTPVLSRLVVLQDGVETQRLEAAQISTGAGKAPVARMRIFDTTGLEVFASSFVADSPDEPVVGNAGNLTLSATASEALQPGTTLAKYTWAIGDVQRTGNTVVWTSPVDGGNVTIRLTVADSDGNEDTQVVTIALKPGFLSKSLSFTGTATGVGGIEGVETHEFEVDATSVDNATAQLVRARVLLVPGAATLPVSDLDLTLDDGAGTRLGAQTGGGSQHTIDVDASAAAPGTWLVRVIPDPAMGAQYTVQVTLTWKGINPGIEAFLAQHDDGHTHEH